MILHIAAQKKHIEYCFMKKEYLTQMDIAKYENAITPLKIRGINTTQQHFQMRYIPFVSSSGSKISHPTAKH